MVGSWLRRSGSLASDDDVERGHAEMEASETNEVRDIQAILRLTHEQGLSVREVSERLKISKTTVSTYLLRAGGRAVMLATAAGPRRRDA